MYKRPLLGGLEGKNIDLMFKCLLKRVFHRFFDFESGGGGRGK